MKHTLQSSHNYCIWCDRLLCDRGSAVDCNAVAGPRPRSEEHLIPACLFGELVSFDLCKCCNDFFGATCDHALLNDQRIVEAAKRAGINVRELWSRFEITQMTPSGRRVRTIYKKNDGSEMGSYQPQPELKDLSRLMIVAPEGKVSVAQLGHLRARLVKKVGLKRLNLSSQQIESEVDKLLDETCRTPDEAHYNPVIREWIKPSRLPPEGIVVRETRPWETEWSLAKICFELSQLLWPPNYREYCAPVLNELRAFLTARECSDDGKSGVGIFTYSESLDCPAKKWHTVEGVVCAFRASWRLTFFGTVSWSYSRELTPLRSPPDPGYCIQITNSFDGPQAQVSVRVTPLT